MPPILSCLVARRLCENADEDHWSLRRFAAGLMATVCSKYGSNYQTLQSRVTRTLLRAFLDPAKPLTTHFGAITGLTLLGPDVIKALILPNMKAYLSILTPELDNPSSHPTKKMEGQYCHNALLVKTSSN
jgi:transcription initiation factor TFIID subunit 6